MTIPANFPSWLERGDDLQCFSSRIAQARYANAWEFGDAVTVVSELERIFTRVHRMPALNWLSCPDVVALIDGLIDGPLIFPEDWTEGDFIIQTPTSDTTLAKWLTPTAWDELLVITTREFLFMSGSEKVEMARQWRDRCLDIALSQGHSLNTLAWAYSWAQFIVTASGQSEALRTIVGLDNIQTLTDIAPVLHLRASVLNAARARVLDPAIEETALLTMTALRSCEHIFQVDRFLERATTDLTANLLTYLRCMNAPNTFLN